LPRSGCFPMLCWDDTAESRISSPAAIWSTLGRHLQRRKHKRKHYDIGIKGSQLFLLTQRGFTSARNYNMKLFVSIYTDSLRNCKWPESIDKELQNSFSI
jgi:hypothetical protein